MAERTMKNLLETFSAEVGQNWLQGCESADSKH